MVNTLKSLDKLKQNKSIIFYFCILTIIWSLVACQAVQPVQPEAGAGNASEQTGPSGQVEVQSPVAPGNEAGGEEAPKPGVEDPSQTQPEPQTSETDLTPAGQPAAEQTQPEKPAQSEEEIRAIYQENPHAVTFVVDDAGQNNTCAQCHAPVNWMPSMDTIPESCLTCKFEIKDPPSYIAETEWEHIPCKVCHEEGKKGKINPEIAWLAIAQIGEYAAVSSSTEICMNCHSPIDLPDHSMIQLGSAHADYTCTQCHDAHSYQASCTASGCHDQTLDPALGIAGHDAEHSNVDCFACHDGGNMEVGPDPETGIWTTLAYKSHQLELAASCQKCHYTGNTWGLSVVEK